MDQTQYDEANCKRTTYNSIIGIANDKIFVLKSTFEYNDGWGGATGVRIQQLTQDQIDYGRNQENLKDLWKDAVVAHRTTLGLEDWIDKVNKEIDEEDRVYFLLDDPSFRYDMDEAYHKLSEEQQKQLDEVFGKIGKDFVDWDSCGCGSCIPTDEKDYTLLFNPDILKIAQEAEKKRGRGV